MTFSMSSFVFKFDTAWTQDVFHSFNHHSHTTVSEIGREVRKQRGPFLLKSFEFIGFQESLDFEAHFPMRFLSDYCTLLLSSEI